MKLEDMDAGQIASFYTQKGYFCTVKPAYAIDKIRIDFVKKGTGGKENFSIYVSMDRFDLLCDDILSFRFQKTLDADKANAYPQAWNYITGENGCKELHIGAGKNNPIVIQGRDKAKNLNAFIGILSYDELRIMAKDFRRTSTAAFEKKAKKCVEESEKYRKDQADVYEETSYAPEY